MPFLRAETGRESVHREDVDAEIVRAGLVQLGRRRAQSRGRDAERHLRKRRGAGHLPSD